jgi:hypothetical protein
MARPLRSICRAFYRNSTAKFPSIPLLQRPKARLKVL